MNVPATAPLNQKHACCDCVGEPFLQREIIAIGCAASCDYCGGFQFCIVLQDLAERVEAAFEDHYTRTADQPELWQERLLADRESREPLQK